MTIKNNKIYLVIGILYFVFLLYRPYQMVDEKECMLQVFVFLLIAISSLIGKDIIRSFGQVSKPTDLKSMSSQAQRTTIKTRAPILLFTFLCILLVAYASIRPGVAIIEFFNAKLDTSASEIHKVRIISKRSVRAGAVIEVSSWRRPGVETFHIGLFDKIIPGEFADVETRKGFLGYEWVVFMSPSKPGD